MAHLHSHDLSWSKPLSIDLLLKVLNVTFFHPFVAWMLPLCMRAQAMPWSHPAIQISIFYASTLTALFFLNILNLQIAYSKPRKVDFSDEVIVITGGASGLGLLIAEVYGMRGATVAVLDVKDLESGEARGVSVYKCDVGDREQVAKVAVEIERDLGTPTILINNAAIVKGATLLDLSLDDIEKNFRVNLLSHFYTLKAFLPGMLRSQAGTIITISSVIGHLGAAQLSDYSASKAGLIALHKSLTAELASTPNIKTVLVTPGQMSTPLFNGTKTPSPFFAPVLEPVDVAKEVIKMIDAGCSAELAMPLYARWIGWMGVLPVGVQAVLRRQCRNFVFSNETLAIPDINRHFTNVLDLGANACNIARALTLPDPDPDPSKATSPPLSTRLSQLTAADSSRAMLYRDIELPFNKEISITRDVLSDEERLPYEANTFDAVLSSLSIHWINDLPSLLSQVNRVLKPDSPFIAAMFGGDTLYELRTSLQLSDQERRGGVSPHISPLADVRDMGGLLQRAGFQMLTVDVDDIIVDFPDTFALMQDLQAMGESNAILGREAGAIRREVLLANEGIYRELHGNEDGSLPATFRMIYMIGWKEGPDQAKPLPRGSGQLNIKDILGGGDVR
ncbi:hypothetical protein B7494_g6286 [Chlorociboria aeruginascens]|nr:hypothetical protein B7494_g6286 [Chlorociboria aeruginascens]